MKKITLTLFTVLSAFCADAQFTGKPIYNIRVERADTLLGNIEVELFPNIAPLHTANFDSIAQAGGYDSTAFHRVISDFMIQGGDPNSVSGDPSTWGQGNPNQATVDAEFTELLHTRGRLSAARSNDPNSASSQFFICHGDPTFLDGDYSCYGEAISGMDVVDVIVNAPKDLNDRPLETIRMYVDRIGSNDSVPEAPTLVSPLDGITGITSGTVFQWNTVSTAKLYLFEIAEDASFASVVYSKETKNTSLSYDSLLQGYTTYYWRVRTNNGGHYSTIDNSQSFVNNLIATQLILPSDNDKTGSKVFFDWSDVADADSYRLMVSEVSNFAVISFIVLDTIVESSHYKLNTDLELNKKYYWKVIPLKNNEAGDESEVYGFTPEVISTIENASGYEINVYPNPVSNVLNIEIYKKSALIIFDAKGVIIYNAQLNRGLNSINTQNFEPGFYTVSIVNENQKSKGNFIKK